MKAFIGAMVLAALPVAVFAEDAPAAKPVATRGKMLLDSSGARIAPVAQVGADGSVQVIYDGRYITVPASTLSINDGKLTTSLKRGELSSGR